ncbi:MAG: T9SS type A sorting domain-containing protein [Bacteroidota bacterium]
MKKIILPVLFLLMYTFANGQTTWNFEDPCSNYSNSFYLGCIPNAMSTSGTPDTQGEDVAAFPLAYEGRRYAHMYSRADHCPNDDTAQEHGEGIALRFSFQPNKTYIIKMHLQCSDFTSHTNAEIALTNGFLNFGGTDAPDIPPCQKIKDKVQPLPAGSKIIANYPSYSFVGHNWIKKTIIVSGLTQIFSQLSIRPRNSQPSGNEDYWNMYVDSVTITECPQANFNYALCQIGTKIQVTISGSTGAAGQWTLYKANNCAGGTEDWNLSNGQSINWTNTNLTQFLVGFNTGCYVIEQVIPASNECPETRIRRLFDSNYAPGYILMGEFLFQQNTPCSGGLTYSADCIPSFTYINGVDHWTVKDLTSQTTNYYTTTGTLSLDLISAHSYHIEHYITLNDKSVGYCVQSDIGIVDWRCTNAPGMVVKSTTLEGATDIMFSKKSDQRTSSETELPVNNAVLTPNPMVSGYAVLKTNSSLDNAYDVTIYDLNGRAIRVYHEVTDSELQIDRTGMTSGVYFVKVTNGSGFRQTLKLLVQ